MYVEEIAKLGMRLLVVSELLALAAIILLPRTLEATRARQRWCIALMVLAHAALIGAIICVVYETVYYGL